MGNVGVDAEIDVVRPPKRSRDTRTHHPQQHVTVRCRRAASPRSGWCRRPRSVPCGSRSSPSRASAPDLHRHTHTRGTAPAPARFDTHAKAQTIEAPCARLVFSMGSQRGSDRRVAGTRAGPPRPAVPVDRSRRDEHARAARRLATPQGRTRRPGAGARARVRTSLARSPCQRADGCTSRAESSRRATLWALHFLSGNPRPTKRRVRQTRTGVVEAATTPVTSRQWRPPGRDPARRARFRRRRNLQGLDPEGRRREVHGCESPPTNPAEDSAESSADGAELPLQLLDLVAQPGRLFEPQVTRGVGHLVLQRLDEPPEVVGRDVGEVEHAPSAASGRVRRAPTAHARASARSRRRRAASRGCR